MKRLLSLIGLTLALSLPFHTPARSQESITTILNACYDPVGNSLRASPWAGSPGSGLTPTEILNAIYVAASGADQAYVRFREITRGETPPATCTAEEDLFVDIATGALCICNAGGDGFICGEGGAAVITALCNLSDVDCTIPPEVGWVLTVDSIDPLIASFSPPAATVIEDLAVTTAKLDDDAVTTIKITDANVTNAKLDIVNGNVGTFGSTTQSVQVTVNAQGRVTAISNQEISGIPTGSVGPAELESTAVTPGVCGDATHVCEVTTDADGRITNQQEVEITGVGGGGPDITLDSLRFTPVVETTTCDMTKSAHKITPSGTTTCTLFAATDTAKPGIYTIDIMNANGVSIAPTGSDLINGVNATLGPITGPLATVRCHNVDTTANWRCDIIQTAGYGAPVTTLCAILDGDTNSSAVGACPTCWIAHSAQCALPSGKLTTGSVIETCSGWQVVGGTTPPDLSVRWKMDTTELNVNSLAVTPGGPSVTRNFETCLRTIVGEAPGASADTYSTMSGNLVDIAANAPAAGFRSQPVQVNTTGAVVITQESRWNAAGGTPSTMTQLYMVVKGSGLLP